ncbi:hypothetical protein F5Y05DRAFT_394025 [Hypoxylon sp. FL0543]|nr:hypothetical protein F5Y05DRAFT_394025 [Hypoxylon sp. FL0543]
MVRITLLFIGVLFFARGPLGWPIPASKISQTTFDSRNAQLSFRPALEYRGRIKTRARNLSSEHSDDKVHPLPCGNRYICSSDNNSATVGRVTSDEEYQHIDAVTTGFISTNVNTDNNAEAVRSGYWTAEATIAIAVGVPAAIASVVGAWAGILALRRKPKPRNRIQKLFRCG